jgi:hypothetical protein
MERMIPKRMMAAQAGLASFSHHKKIFCIKKITKPSQALFYRGFFYFSYNNFVLKNLGLLCIK